jgi:hypothetical protein
VHDTAVVIGFNDAINRRDLAALARLMSADHRFIDGDARRVDGDVVVEWRVFTD